MRKTIENEQIMRIALNEAEKSARASEGPFAVVVVGPDGNTVWKDHSRKNELTDPTAHAELNAVRHLCKQLKTMSLKGYSFYTTSEPCPTCLSAMIKAQVSYSYFGARTQTTASLPIPAEVIASYAKKFPIEIVGGILESECLEQRNRYT